MLLDRRPWPSLPCGQMVVGSREAGQPTGDDCAGLDFRRTASTYFDRAMTDDALKVSPTVECDSFDLASSPAQSQRNERSALVSAGQISHATFLCPGAAAAAYEEAAFATLRSSTAYLQRSMDIALLLGENFHAIFTYLLCNCLPTGFSVTA